MTYWYDKTEEPKRRSHWMRIAMSFATDLGLLHPSVLADLKPSLQQLRRRLWWCCLMRDHLISFSERQQSSIPWDENEFLVLSIDDLDSVGLSKALERCQVPDPVKESKILTELCFQKIRLCVLIGRILRTQYELSSYRRISSSRPKLCLLPKSSGSASAEYMSRDQELQEWGDDICKALHKAVDLDPRRNSVVIAVHGAVIEMLYFNVLGMVHRPQTRTSPREDSAAKAIQRFSQQTLSKVAARISEITKYLAEADLLRFLPPIGLTVLLFSGMQNVKDSCSPSLSAGNTASQGVEQVMHAMGRLKDMYPQAHHAVTVLELVRDKGRHVGDEESSTLGQEAIASIVFFRNEFHQDQGRSDTSGVSNAPAGADRTWPGQVGASTEPAVVTTWSRAGIDYSGRNHVDFESLLSFEQMSDVFMSGGFDVADFEQVNWSEVFLERNWDL